MNRLKNIPLSAPSITAMPVANPARTNFNPAYPRRLLQIAASARKVAASAEHRVPTPQQAFERKLLFNSAAIPPSRQTIGRKPKIRKQNVAASPSVKTKTGARNLAEPMGPRSHIRKKVKLGAE